MRRKIFAALLAPAVAFGIGACSVEQTEEGDLPEVQGGNQPEFDVDAADVDVNMDSATIPVPNIDVNSPDSTQRDSLPR